MRRAAWIAAGLLLVPARLFSGEKGTAVSFRLYHGYAIVAEGSIGRLKNLRFVIDTGAAPSIVSRKVARKLALSGGKEKLSVFNRSLEGERVVLPSLEFGPLRVRSIPLLAQDLSVIEQGLGTPVDAMIGLDVLGRSDFSIDYARKRITFDLPAVLPGAAVVPFDLGPGYITVRVELENSSIRLLVDTGAKDLVFFEPRVARELAGIRILTETTAENLAGKVRLRRAQLRFMRLGTVSLARRHVSLLDGAEGVPDFDGLLGLAGLGVKRVGFDFRNRTLSWEGRP